MNEEKMLLENQGLIGDIIKKELPEMVVRKIGHEDLMQIGNIGLLKAIRKGKLKGELHCKFAKLLIIQEIMDQIRNYDWPIKLPRPKKYKKQETIDSINKAKQINSSTDAFELSAYDLETCDLEPFEKSERQKMLGRILDETRFGSEIRIGKFVIDNKKKNRHLVQKIKNIVEYYYDPLPNDSPRR